MCLRGTGFTADKISSETLGAHEHTNRMELKGCRCDCPRCVPLAAQNCLVRGSRTVPESRVNKLVPFRTLKSNPHPSTVPPPPSKLLLFVGQNRVCDCEPEKIRMKFTLIFPSHEASDLSVGAVFASSLFWVVGEKELSNPHPLAARTSHTIFQDEVCI